MLNKNQIYLILITVSMAPLSAFAQQVSASRPAIPVLSASDNAQFMRVDEGIFEIQLGRTIDITDKKTHVHSEKN